MEELKTIMDPAKRDSMARRIARYKNENVLGGMTTYQPMITLAWRADKVDFKAWPGGAWRVFQDVAVKK